MLNRFIVESEELTIHGPERTEVGGEVKNFNPNHDELGRFAEGDTNFKQEQFDRLQAVNPMHDDYHVGIRKVEDIKTFAECVEGVAGMVEDEKEYYVYPDWTLSQAKECLKKGKVTIYSSKKIEEGVFVTPSKMMASDYAGSGEVYEKEIDLDDVAWISGDEGNYIPKKKNGVSRNGALGEGKVENFNSNHDEFDLEDK